MLGLDLFAHAKTTKHCREKSRGRVNHGTSKSLDYGNSMHIEVHAALQAHTKMIDYHVARSSITRPSPEAFHKIARSLTAEVAQKYKHNYS